MFKALNVNLSLLEVLEKVLKYVKLLREVMSKRKKIEREEQFALNAKCSVVVSRRVPPKLKDPDSFTIFIEIRGVNFGKVFCNLGASLGDHKETLVTLQLADRSLVHLKGVLEDILVRVRKFILLIDFIVLDFEKDLDIPILLRRSFLTTFLATIDVGKGEMKMEVGEEVETYRVCSVKLLYPMRVIAISRIVSIGLQKFFYVS
ncbi:hypothetical protein ES288_D01G156100v1 [Gossypium darwinii]|uniref:Uncharacterized protein n=1 Tax=Gossypium darwinii TaxID=34276 RepID=A0A5D2DQH4_GOSDA|nr:hypothetical protein ES288_D01G156100v1 [Gossypium darwinii]